MTDLEAKLQEAAELALNYGIDLYEFRTEARKALVRIALEREGTYRLAAKKIKVAIQTIVNNKPKKV